MSNNTDPQDPTPPSTVFTVNTNFGFGSGGSFQSQDPNTLGENEYTLAVIIVDLSGSVINFQHLIREAIQTIVMDARRHTRRKMMMVAVLGFHEHTVVDICGFVQVEHIDVQAILDKVRVLDAYQRTPLRDGIARGLEMLETYAATLCDEHSFTVNGAIFVLTDGEENSSVKASSWDAIRDAFIAIRPKGEEIRNLESVVALALGVGTDLTPLLNYGFDRVEKIEDARPGTFASFANWVSSHIQGQSQALGTGRPSQILSI